MYISISLSISICNHENNLTMHSPDSHYNGFMRAHSLRNTM